MIGMEMNLLAIDSMVFKSPKAILNWKCEFSTTYHVPKWEFSTL